MTSRWWLTVSTWRIASGLLWLTATATIMIAMSQGVVRESVQIHLADGTPIRGTLYRPPHFGIRVPIAVVVHGMATDHHSCVPSLAIPLARNGYLTLAIDVRGHGQSGGSLPRGELDDPIAALDTLSEQPEIDAAIDYMKQHPLFIEKYPMMRPGPGPAPRTLPMQLIAVIGHSRGGWAAANVGYRRKDVDSVVCIGAAPGVCDVSRPHNFLVVTGNFDELFPVQRCVLTTAQASSGQVSKDEQSSGSYRAGTARLLKKINDVNHFTELASPALTRNVVQWVGGSLDIDAGPVPGTRLKVLVAAVLLASLGGLLPTTWALCSCARVLFQESSSSGAASGWRLALFFLGLTLVVPVVAAVAPRVEIGPVYFAGSSILLLSAIGLTGWGVGRLGGGKPSFPREAPFQAWSLAALVLGAISLLLGIIWLGIPWGLTWAGLVPTTRRFLLAVVLFPLFFPACLALAHGFEQLVGEGKQRWGDWTRGLSWAGIPVVLWCAFRWLSVGAHPLFVVPIALLGATFLVPLPLWLLPGRGELTFSRALSHAGAVSWLLACHLPFVHNG